MLSPLKMVMNKNKSLLHNIEFGINRDNQKLLEEDKFLQTKISQMGRIEQIV